MAKPPDRRPSARAGTLSGAGGAAPARPAGAAPRRGRRAMLAGLALVALGLAAGTGWWLGSRGEPPVVLPSAAQAAAAALPEPIATAQAAGATYQELLDGRSDDWRVARLALNPKILVIEFPDLASQGRTLNRLAALIEKAQAPRDRVLGDQALAELIRRAGDSPATFYFGHDYPAEAVARFFTLAVHQQQRLNDSEMRLGNLLLFAGLLKEENDRLVAAPDRQAVVTFTAVQADDPATPADEGVDARRREAILRHELSHGEFFTNGAYREHCWRFWQRLSDEERTLFRHFLVSQGYDPRNEELMVNEAQAYLMHTPDLRAFSATVFGVPVARLDALRARFREGLPPTIFSGLGR
ncbi:hypothetical protein [Piscinibacter sakaiensis]|uniref:Uncharacterized protein n=1 Tax=Piscinibacter sakaiensis TaxID=1547922 RepID=A0A0K8P0W9_PISS1|nr:hypothetical protein [Piscinibacter sakaiensis]GAP36307.1 hypothetical protein ISF6_2147 [Piscinibacter sakaiensis]